MTRRALTSFFTAAAVTMAMPLLAQDSKGSQGQSRPNPGGGNTGSAVSRPSGGSGGSSSGGGSSSSAGSSSGSGGGSSSASRPSGGSNNGNDSAYRAPRPERRAVPRGSSSNSSDDQQRRVNPSSGSSASSSEDNGDRRRAVPAYSRPREGRTTVGTAVPRTGRPPTHGGDGGYYYNPYYRYSYYYNRYPYGYYSPAYGFGVGYFYDPWMWGAYSPYGGVYDPYYGYGGGYSRGQYRDGEPYGALRLKVKPEYGQVYVDGYYVGEVDAFDGVFQRMPIEAGTHRIEIRADGYETAQFEVMVIRGETVTFKGDLKRK